MCTTSTNASAFAGAPHWTATKAGLAAADFDEGASRRVYIAANEVDYMKNLNDKASAAVPYLSILAPILTGAMLAWSDKLKAETLKLTYFHFDLLMTPIEVERYSLWLERGTEQTVRSIMKSEQSDTGKAARLLDALGISLHTVQDLYAHSTLATQDWNAWMGNAYPTYEEIPEEIRRSPLANLQSGDCNAQLFGRGSVGTLPGHGDSGKSCVPYGNSANKYANRDGCGYNKDTATRPHHLRAMYMAIRATELWAKKFRKWVGNDGIWKSMQTFANASWVWSCYDKAAYTGSGARAWSHSEGGYSIPTMLYGLGIACDDKWEDEWLKVLNEMYKAHGAPYDTIGKAGDDQGKFAIKAPWELGGGKGRPPLDRKGNGADPSDFVGKYKAKFGTTSATIELAADAQSPDELKGTLTVAAGGSFPIRGLVNGPSFDFAAGEESSGYIGHVYLMSHGKKALAGTITFVKEGKTGHGIPRGIFATKQ